MNIKGVRFNQTKDKIQSSIRNNTRNQPKQYNNRNLSVDKANDNIKNRKEELKSMFNKSIEAKSTSRSPEHKSPKRERDKSE